MNMLDQDYYLEVCDNDPDLETVGGLHAGSRMEVERSRRLGSLMLD